MSSEVSLSQMTINFLSNACIYSLIFYKGDSVCYTFCILLRTDFLLVDLLDKKSPENDQLTGYFQCFLFQYLQNSKTS